MRPPGRIYQPWPWVEHFDLPPGLCIIERRQLAPLRREIGVAGHFCSPFVTSRVDLDARSQAIRG